MAMRWLGMRAPGITRRDHALIFPVMRGLVPRIHALLNGRRREWAWHHRVKRDSSWNGDARPAMTGSPSSRPGRVLIKSGARTGVSEVRYCPESDGQSDIGGGPNYPVQQISSH